MSVLAEKTVREVALENPSATRVFEKLGIDYCCGGNKPLHEVCDAAGLSVSEVQLLLEEARKQNAANPGDTDWTSAPLANVAAHIINTHHKYTREEIQRLEPLLNKVCGVHGQRHPELLHIQTDFEDLAQEMRMHMMKEEGVLFPYIIKMEQAVLEKSAVPRPPFGSLQNPISMMEHEHESSGHGLQAIREASNNFTPPPDACVSYQTLYRTLKEFEADMHQHIALENNILFPRALAMEAGQQNA